MARAAHHRDRAGFTFMELLVALVISGILVTVIFQTLLGFARVAEQQSAREEVQQNARAAIELISSELRATTVHGLTVESNRIIFRLPSARGLLCRVDGDVVHVLFPPGSETLAADTLASLGFGGSEDAFPVRREAAANQPGDFAECTGDDRLGTLDQGAGLQVRRLMVEAPAPADPDPADHPVAVYLFRTVEYGVDSFASAPGLWLYRRSRAGVPRDPLAGPLPDVDGLRFEHDTTVTVGGIDISITMKSRHDHGPVRETETVATRVYPRN